MYTCDTIQAVWWKSTSYCCSSSFLSCTSWCCAVAPFYDSREYICWARGLSQIKYEEEDGKYLLPATLSDPRKHIFLSNCSLNFTNSFPPPSHVWHKYLFQVHRCKIVSTKFSFSSSFVLGRVADSIVALTEPILVSSLYFGKRYDRLHFLLLPNFTKNLLLISWWTLL